MLSLSAKIEALLFIKTEAMSLKEIASFLNASEDEVRSAVLELKNSLQSRGLTLIEKADEILLGTQPEASSLIEKLFKDELERDLGKAGLETISIILYKGPIAKSDIDFIRGVNSQYILRALLIRGLIERTGNTKNRSPLYQGTFDLLRFLGISSVKELPDYETVQKSLSESISSEEEPLETVDEE